jgi:sulfite reductase (ferredoxin)
LFKDLRGVACPMNFVKTKVELSKIASGEVLKIFLDDGEPIDNVPRSVLGEGHKIIEQEKTGEYWIVVIEKGKKDK